MRQEKMLRFLVPRLGLALLAIFAALYTVDPKVYYQSLVAVGAAWTYPFIDWEFIGAGIKCCMLIRLTPNHTIGSLAVETSCRHARRCPAPRGSALSGFTAGVPRPVS